MRAILLSAALLAIGCDDPDPIDKGPVFGDYVTIYAGAMQDWAVRCGRFEAEYTAARTTQTLCARWGCDTEMSREIDMTACLAAIDSLACDAEMHPYVCTEELSLIGP